MPIDNLNLENLAIGTFAIVYLVILGFSALIGITLFLFQGFGLYSMSKKLGFENGWISFIPIANIYSLGRIAEKYVKNDGKKSAKFSLLLILFYAIEMILLIAFFVIVIVLAIRTTANAEMAIANDAEMTMNILSVVLLIVLFYLLLLGIAITYCALYYVALWRVFAIFDNKNATVYIVLSIFFSFFAPIFLFVIRKKEPKCTYPERMGLEPIIE